MQILYNTSKYFNNIHPVKFDLVLLITLFSQTVHTSAKLHALQTNVIRSACAGWMIYEELTDINPNL